MVSVLQSEINMARPMLYSERRVGFFEGRLVSNCSSFEEGGCLDIYGEFDPGSGRTLAACLTHASRTVKPFGVDQWRTGE